MKYLTIAAIAVLLVLPLSIPAQQRVGGSTRSDGTVVAPYTRGGSSAAGTGAGADYGSGAGAGFEASTYVVQPNPRGEYVYIRGGRYPVRSLVYVGGYFRKDGTYVRPHYRTKADGILENNISYRPKAQATLGDSSLAAPKPVALKDETSIEPFPPASPQEQAARTRAAQVLRDLGYPVDWQRHSASELALAEAPARKAAFLRTTYGVDLDWRVVPFPQLVEAECALAEVERLEKRGVPVSNWEDYSCDYLRRWADQADRTGQR
jgi:hypothetical protein